MYKLKSLLFCTTLISFLCLTHGKSFAASYFVSNSGNDANSGTTETNSWASLTKINGFAFQPGDKILFKRGDSWTGQINITKSGTQTNPITYGAYGPDSNAKPVISYSSCAQSSLWSCKAVSLTPSSAYVIVENLALKDAVLAAVYIDAGSHHNTVRDVEAFASGQGVEIRGTDNLITNNHFHDLKMVVNTVGGDDDWGATGIIIRNNNNEISYNRIVNAKAASYDYGFDGGTIEFYSTSNSVSGNYIHHNYGEGNDGFIEVGSRGPQTMDNNTIAYNVSYNNRKFVSVHLYDATSCTSGFAAKVNNMRIENNTIVEPTNSGKQIFWIWCPATPQAISFKNNILYSAVNFGSSNQLGFTHSNNLYYMIGSATMSSSFANSSEITSKDPLFTNLGTKDFHLQSTSPAINKGLNLNWASDFDNKSVPYGGAAPDLGAFEYQGSPSSTDPTVPPIVVTPKIGDSNNDNAVNETDYNAWFSNYNKNVTGKASDGDFNGNGIVDGVDYSLWLNNYGK